MTRKQSNRIWAAWGAVAVVVLGLTYRPRSEPPRYSRMPMMQTMDGEIPKIEIHDDGSVTTNLHPADDIYSKPSTPYRPKDLAFLAQSGTSTEPIIPKNTEVTMEPGGRLMVDPPAQPDHYAFEVPLKADEVKSGTWVEMMTEPTVTASDSGSSDVYPEVKVTYHIEARPRR
jgi:hypothetical protein